MGVSSHYCSQQAKAAWKFWWKLAGKSNEVKMIEVKWSEKEKSYSEHNQQLSFK